MRGLIAMALAGATPAMTPIQQPSTKSQPQAALGAQRFGMYVVSDDLGRAARFYEHLFGPPRLRLPGIVGFDVAGGLYAVVDRATFAPDAVRGTTARGYVKVRDIAAAYRWIVAAEPGSIAAPVATEGRFSFFRVRDPDGALIEFYAVAP